MSRITMDVTVTDEHLQQAQAAVEQLTSTFPWLVSLQADERRGMNRLGPQSEVFCRRTLQVMQQHPQILPPSLPLGLGQRQLRAFDQLRPLLAQLQAFSARLEDSLALLGSGAMDVALEGYNQLGLQAEAHGLEDLRRDIGQRWYRPGRRRRNTAADSQHDE